MPVTNRFHKLIDQFDKTTLQDFYLRDPFAALIPRSSFMTNLGEVPQVLSLTGERPSSYPTDLANVNVVDGPGASGDVVATEVRTGQVKRTYQLEVHAIKSGELNQSDMTFRQDPVTVVRNMEETLRENILAHNADWHRYKSIGMMDHKAVVTGAGAIKESSDANFDFSALVTERQNTAQAGAAGTITLDAGASAVDDTYNNLYIYIVSGTGAGQRRQISDYTGATKVANVSVNWTAAPDATSVFRIFTTDIPAAQMDWDILRYLYRQVSRRGGEAHAVGMAEGKSVFALIVGDEEQTKLFQTDLEANIRYYDPKENFTRRGITKAVRGLLPNSDLFPIRYDENFEMIYPFVNQATTTGFESVLNPDYAHASMGGKAFYEVAYLMTRNIWEVKPRPADMQSLSRANFSAQNYLGEVNFINNKTFNGTNDLGNKGYYRADWQCAAKPIRPYLGYSILFKLP